MLVRVSSGPGSWRTGPRLVANPPHVRRGGRPTVSVPAAAAAARTPSDRAGPARAEPPPRQARSCSPRIHPLEVDRLGELGVVSLEEPGVERLVRAGRRSVGDTSSSPVYSARRRYTSPSASAAASSATSLSMPSIRATGTPSMCAGRTGPAQQRAGPAGLPGAGSTSARAAAAEPSATDDAGATTAAAATGLPHGRRRTAPGTAAGAAVGGVPGTVPTGGTTAIGATGAGLAARAAAR